MVDARQRLPLLLPFQLISNMAEKLSLHPWRALFAEVWS